MQQFQEWHPQAFSKITEQIQELQKFLDAVLIYAGNNEHSSTMYSHCLETQSKNTHTRNASKLQTYRLLTKIFSNKVSIDIDVSTGKQEDCLSNVALQVHKATQPPVEKRYVT